jgi:hypothetical protein
MLSVTKSMDQRWFGLCGDGIITLDPAVPFLCLFLLSANPSS